MAKIQNICNRIGQQSVDIFDTFNGYSGNIKEMLRRQKLDEKYKTSELALRVDQYLLVLLSYNVLIDKTIVMEFMTAKISQNLYSMQKINLVDTCFQKLSNVWKN